MFQNIDMTKVFLLVLLFIGSYSFAQKMRLGPEIGMNLLKIESSKLGKDYQPGLHGGATFEYDFFEWMSVKTGFFYTQKKQSYEEFDTVPLVLFGFDPSDLGLEGIDFNTYSETNGRYNQHHFELPVLANFKWEGINVGIGGYCSFLFNANSKEITESRSPFMQFIDFSSFDESGLLTSFLPKAYDESTSSSSSPSNLRQFDLGFKASIGYQYDQVGFHAAYQYGMLDFRQLNTTTTKIPHQYFQFSVNYLFDLGGKDYQPRLD